MVKVDFKAEAAAMRDELIRRRRDFHRYPELAFQEVRTAGMVAEELTRMGLEVQTGVGKTGVVGILEGEQDGPTVLLRADMDALPIVEENTFPYISTQAGVMHACGHDGHTTIALGVAKLLSQHREQIAGRVKFVFQPAEEIAAGAKAMVADGVLRDPKPDVCVGLHLWNSLPFGQLGVADGPIMAGSSEFILKIQGKGGHAANPHMTIDPVVCAAQLITAFQTIASRNVDPLDSAVISVTQMAAGTAFNVIPQSAELRGTMRFFRLEVRETMERRMNEISRGIAAALGCTVELEIDRQLLPVINHSSVGERLRPIFQQMMGAANLVNERTMGAEDVGLLMGDIPGMYLLLGANPGTEPYYGHHHPRFDFHEDALPVGVALLAAAAAAYILPEG